MAALNVVKKDILLEIVQTVVEVVVAVVGVVEIEEMAVEIVVEIVEMREDQDVIQEQGQDQGPGHQNMIKKY